MQSPESDTILCKGICYDIKHIHPGGEDQYFGLGVRQLDFKHETHHALYLGRQAALDLEERTKSARI